MSKKQIGLFVGSLRKASFSKGIARFIEEQSSTDFEFKIIEIGNLPLYNQDYDGSPSQPEAYEECRKQVKPLDGFLFITPEYNRSVPAVLKNAIDVGSRPYGQSVWSAKPGAIISNSPGVYGGFGANHHLRQSLMFLNVLTMQQPECYLTKIGDSFDEQGNVTADRLKESLRNFITAFETWVNMTAS